MRQIVVAAKKKRRYQDIAPEIGTLLEKLDPEFEFPARQVAPTMVEVTAPAGTFFNAKELKVLASCKTFKRISATGSQMVMRFTCKPFDPDLYPGQM